MDFELKSMQNRTQIEQKQVEKEVLDLIHSLMEKNKKSKEKQSNKSEQNNNKDDEYFTDEDEDEEEIQLGVLNKPLHQKYLERALTNFGGSIKYYDCGHPWVLFWTIRALNIIKSPNFDLKQYHKGIIEILKDCQHPEGGFCGGPYQYPHIASTYAAICTLIELGTEEALSIIDRQGMYNFLRKCQNKSQKGSFLVSEGGEADMRSVYIAMLIQDILNMGSNELIDGVADFVASCQTYEGGIAPEPHGEAHSGLSYCGFAALRILKQEHKINLGRLLYWAGQRQMPFEGGFCGRTNKLAYILLCQCEEGGLFDKPGKYPDVYHTAYSLSGLASAQRNADESGYILLDGNSDNLVEYINVVYNINQEKLDFAKSYFNKLGKLKVL